MHDPEEKETDESESGDSLTTFENDLNDALEETINDTQEDKDTEG